MRQQRSPQLNSHERRDTQHLNGPDESEIVVLFYVLKIFRIYYLLRAICVYSNSPDSTPAPERESPLLDPLLEKELTND